MDRNASPARDESRIDLTLGWQMFRQNSKPFLATQGIAMGVVVGFAVVISGLLSLFGLENSSASNLFVLLFLAPSLLIYLAFQGSLYGLAFDVMSSGDQFTELGGTFRYLGKFWGRYLLLGAILNLSTICLVTIGITFEEAALAHLLELILLFTPVSFVTFAIFVQAGPALTAQAGIKEAFKDNFQTLRKVPRRLFKTWVLFWVIFYLPYFITNIMILPNLDAFIQGDIAGIPFLVVAMFTQTWYYFVGVPVQTLMATRIYNSLHLTPPHKSA